MSLQVNGAPVVSIPIALCLFFMMYPVMVKFVMVAINSLTMLVLYGVLGGFLLGVGRQVRMLMFLT